ncbi:MAG: YdjY domain-containing protein [Thermodesulfobacteriota bacterium]
MNDGRCWWIRVAVWAGALWGLGGGWLPAMAAGPPAAPPPPPAARPAQPSQAGPPAPLVRLITPGRFDVGGCQLDKAAGEVSFPAKVNMDKGLLEYVVVAAGGKVHESLLRTEVEPFALQMALLLAGLEGTLSPLPAQGASELPSGDPVRLTVRWDAGGSPRTVPVEDWLLRRQVPASPLPWVFTGSVIDRGVFMAQTERSLVAIYHDPLALIDHRAEDGASDEIWFVNDQAVPPAGTPVTVTIRRAPASPLP